MKCSAGHDIPQPMPPNNVVVVRANQCGKTTAAKLAPKPWPDFPGLFLIECPTCRTSVNVTFDGKKWVNAKKN